MNTLAAGLQGPDYFILVGYFVIMLGIGAYFWRFMKGMADFFTGRNQIPWWLSGISFYMTSFSAFLFVAYSENAHRFGFAAITLGWAVVPAVLVGGLFLSARWRRARITSPAEYLEERYGLAMRQTVAWARIVVQLIDDGLKIYATGQFVAIALGLGERYVYYSIICTGLITLAYTFMGGLWSVTVTDFVQFLVMLVGAVVLVPLALAKVGGLTGLYEGSPPGFFQPFGGPYTWQYLLGWFLLVLWNYNTSFGLVQRYYSVRNEREARKTGVFVAFLCLVSVPIFVLPALAARQFLPDADPKTIYATICVTLLPSGMLGLIIAAMFSATMSTLSGDYNVISAVLTNDVYNRLINPNASQRHLVTIGRLTTFLIGLIPIGIGLYLATGAGQGVLFQKMAKLFSVAAPSLAIPMLAGIVWRQTNNAGAMAGFLGGLVAGLILLFAGWKEQTIAMITSSTVIVLIVTISFVIRPKEKERQRSSSFFRKLDTPIPPAESAVLKGGPSPFFAVGLSTTIVSLMLLAVVPFMEWDVSARTNLEIGLFLLILGVFWVIRGRGTGEKSQAP